MIKPVERLVDLVRIERAVGEAVEEARRDLVNLGRGFYAEEWRQAHISPSMIGRLELCPWLLWREWRDRTTYLTEEGLKAAARGKLIHRAVQEVLGGIAEYKVERKLRSGIVIAGVVDVLLPPPVEIKTGAVPKPWWKLQAMTYAVMLNTPYAYLATMRHVERVEADPRTAARALRRVYDVVTSPTSPKPRDCSVCIFKRLCARLRSRTVFE